MKKLISIILCMTMLAGVLAFAGCKNNKDNQDTTAASTGIDAVDAADTTESSADSTAAESSTAKETKPSGRPTPRRSNDRGAGGHSPDQLDREARQR